MKELELIQKIIAESTRFHKTYVAKVIDNDNNGRVKVIIPALGVFNDNAVWADIEHNIDTNVISYKDKWVSLYFLNGDSGQPVVRGMVTNMKDNVPQTTYDKRLLYKDDKMEVMFDIGSNELHINAPDTKIFIQGNATDIKADGDVTLKANGKVTINNHMEISQ